MDTIFQTLNGYQTQGDTNPSANQNQNAKPIIQTELKIPVMADVVVGQNLSNFAESNINQSLVQKPFVQEYATVTIVQDMNPQTTRTLMIPANNSQANFSGINNLNSASLAQERVEIPTKKVQLDFNYSHSSFFAIDLIILLVILVNWFKTNVDELGGSWNNHLLQK